ADATKEVVDVARAAQVRLATAQATLAQRGVELNDALAAARRTTNELASARSSRLAFIARLRSEQRLKAQQISALQRAAQQVEAKSAALQAAADTAAATPSPASIADETTTAPTPSPQL